MFVAEEENRAVAEGLSAAEEEEKVQFGLPTRKVVQN